MSLSALLLSRDPEIVRLTGEVLKELDIELTPCSEGQEALRLIAETAFDAILVDNANASGAVAVLSAANSLPSCQQSVGIVLAASLASLGLAQGARSHMVLYRPLSAERLRNGVKSALRLRGEGEDLRESQRTPIEIAATLRGAGLEDTLVFITNLSAGGAALQVGRSVPSSSIHSIEFTLPDSHQSISSGVELVWRDVQGGMGVRFSGLQAESSRLLEEWLANHSALAANAAAV